MTQNKLIFLAKNKLAFFIILSIIFDFIYLSNILSSDYFGDDLYNFQVTGTIPYEHSTIFSLTIDSIFGWMNIGRFFPFAFFIQNYIFEYFDKLFTYKLFVVLAIILNIFLFTYLIVNLTKSRFYYILIILIPILFQYRYYHDPVLSFHGLMPVLWIFEILSLIFFQKYLESKIIWHLVFSVALCLLSLLTYEISYLFILFYPMIIYINQHEDAVFQTINPKKHTELIPFYIIFLLVISISLYIRVAHPVLSGPYAPCLNFLLIAKTFLMQVMSLAPMTYFLCFERYYDFVNFIKFHHAFLMISFLFLIYHFSKISSDDSNRKRILLFGIMIIVVPAILISFSPKFQDTDGNFNAVLFGRPYLPIYLQTFGFALLIAVLIERFKDTMGSILILFLLSIVVIMHSVSNDIVISKVNAQYKQSRELLTAFIKDDLIKKLHDGQTIYLENEAVPFHSKAFFRMLTSKKIDVIFDPNLEYDYHISYEITKDLGYVYLYGKQKRFMNMSVFELNNSYKKLNNSELANTQSLHFNNFFPWEGNYGSFRWSKGNANIQIYNLSSNTSVRKMCFQLGSVVKRDLSIGFNSTELENLTLEPRSKLSRCFTLHVQPGTNSVDFVTKTPPSKPNNGDTRELSFSIQNFEFK